MRLILSIFSRIEYSHRWNKIRNANECSQNSFWHFLFLGMWCQMFKTDNYHISDRISCSEKIKIGMLGNLLTCQIFYILNSRNPLTFKTREDENLLSKTEDTIFDSTRQFYYSLAICLGQLVSGDWPLVIGLKRIHP